MYMEYYMKKIETMSIYSNIRKYDNYTAPEGENNFKPVDIQMHYMGRIWINTA